MERDVPKAHRSPLAGVSLAGLTWSQVMVISAQISIYPLRQERLSPAIQAVSHALTDAGLQPEVGPMSTLVTGEAEVVFAALRAALVQAAATGHVVLTVTLSNACPVRA